MMQLVSFLFLGHDGYSQKIMQDDLCFAPVLTNTIPGRKLIASAKNRTATIGNNGVFRKSLGIVPALFHGWSTTRLFHNKNIRTLSTLLNHCITVLELLILHCR